MAVWRNKRWRTQILAAVAASLIMLPSMPVAFAADAQSSPGFFEKLFSIFAPPQGSGQPQEGAKLKSAGQHAGSADSNNPMFPYAGNSQDRSRRPASYRTVCVRLCDGFYWPVSPATSMEHFRRDSSVCESSCSQPAKLFYVPSEESDVGQSVGLDGKPYTSLEHAFSYRKSLQPNCQCKPSPWADSEIARHRQYAADERALSPQFATLDQAAPVSSPVEDAAPIPDTDVQSDAVAAGIAPAAPELRAAASESVIGADGTEPAYADPLPVALQGLPKAKRSKSGQGRAKSAAQPFAGGPIPWLMFNPSSFGVQTVDRDRHR